MSSQTDSHDLFWDTEGREDASSTTSVTETLLQSESLSKEAGLSLFEAVVTSYPPILESFLSHLPTTSVFDLYHTSKHLRAFLRSYPLAWKTLSFRLPQPALVLGSPGNETPDGRERQSKTYALDALLKQVVHPYSTRLTSLDLCNTAVSGIALIGNVLAPRLATLQHLSVRGCKNVSIKYHLVPFLEPYTTEYPYSRKDLALRSLYTYRCRHHRRRPYLPSSLVRRDSDSDPTHQLIEICHQLGIWTDTAWCPTPGGRCFRRKDYHQGRAGPGNTEVWVPFDRLWRSSNRIGVVDEKSKKIGVTDGRLWEINETGQDGEPLGSENGPFQGEGKHTPAHLRRSHRIFVDDVKCSQCNDPILERCESCSVRMHCMGCRKTLCASCAFNRPIPRKRVKTRHFASLAFGMGTNPWNSTSQASQSSSLEAQDLRPVSPATNRFWWAPGATRSPNLMNEPTNDEDESDSEDGNMNNGLPAPPTTPPKLNMHWCCLEPIFSGGGGIAVLGTGLGGRGADKIRAAPLPRTKEYEDPDFSNQLRPVDYVRELKNNGLCEYVLGEDVDLLSYLKQDSLDLQASTCPRGLCQDCYRSFRWKVSCRGCKKPLCKEHDFRALKFRKCGFRDMHAEREHVRSHNAPPRLQIPAFNPDKSKGKQPASRGNIASSAKPSESPPSLSSSQSQILAPPAAPAAIEMSSSNSMTSHTPDPFASSISSVPPLFPFSSSRPRSLSASGVRSRNSGSWSYSPRATNPIANPLPLPCHPRHPVQWEGCGAYFCQSPRPVGDARTRCPAVLKECAECMVLVCDACASTNPTCTCTFCTVHYHCPVCARKPDVKAQCRFEEELKAKKEAEVRAKEKMEKEKEMRDQADHMAETVWEFWEGLAGDMITGPSAPLSAGPSSPPPNDSITVTTEFGVIQEPSNFTTIVAVSQHHPPVHTSNNYQSHGYEHEDEHLQEYHEQSDQMPSTPTTTPASLDNESEADDQDEEETVSDLFEDVEIEEDDFDAESAVIDEFIYDEDDHMMTPTVASGSTHI